jgi:hypothetical protein
MQGAKPPSYQRMMSNQYQRSHNGMVQQNMTGNQRFKIISSIYPFINATFTALINGQIGPTYSQALSAMSGTGISVWQNNTSYFNTINGIQIWTVPKTGLYTINATGAAGAASAGTYVGGAGARVQGTFQLTAGTKLRILVGQMGLTGSTYGGGGGGGSFVMKETGSNVSDIYLIAGGGGGSGYSTSALALGGTTSPTGTNNASNDVLGGMGGYGGLAASAGTYVGGGGGGLLSDGFVGNLQGPNYGGTAFINGGAGGLSQGTINSSFPHGGFGCGGSGCICGGGGGGYSGGGAGGLTLYSGGGGGASYNNGSDQIMVSGINTGSGSVTITYLY